MDIEGASVYDCLIYASETAGFSVEGNYYPEYDSYLVEAIETYENGDEDKYWKYFVNGEYSSISADKNYVEDVT